MFTVGDPLPTVAALAADHGVALSTAQRALSLLKAWGLIDVARGRRARVLSTGLASEPADPVDCGGDVVDELGEEQVARATPQLWAITVRGPDGRRRPARHVREDIDNQDAFRSHLLAIARIDNPHATDDRPGWIGGYELDIADPNKPGDVPVRVLRWND